MSCNVLSTPIMSSAKSVKPQFAGWKSKSGAASAAVALGMAMKHNNHASRRLKVMAVAVADNVAVAQPPKPTPIKPLPIPYTITLEDMQALEAQKHGENTYVLLRNDLGFKLEYVRNLDFYGAEYIGLPFPMVIENGEVASFLHQTEDKCGCACDLPTEPTGLISVGYVIYKGYSVDTHLTYYFGLGWINGNQKLVFAEFLSSGCESADEKIEQEIYSKLKRCSKLTACESIPFREGETLLFKAKWDAGESVFQRTCITAHFKRQLAKGPHYHPVPPLPLNV